MTEPPIGFPERALAVRRGCTRLCAQLGWALLHEVGLPNGRRADILAITPQGDFICIEIKSGPRDFLVDSKWPDYRDYADALYFAVDTDFPITLLPDETGLIVCAANEAEIIRDAPPHKMAAPRRRAMTRDFALLAARRLMAADDPVLATELRAALRAE